MDEKQVEEDYSQLSIEERLRHKAWKARQGAYVELAKQFSLSISDNDPVFDVVRDVSVWKGIVGDPNVAAQEDGVDALVKYLEFASTSDGVRCRSLCVPILAEKGLGSSRAGTKQKSLTALLLFVEIDAPGTVLEDLVTKLNAKSPKVVAALVWAIKEIYRNFGVPTVDPKVGLKHTATLFGHADKNVRNETSALTIELFRWLGEAIMPSLSELKPVQLKELKASFADVDRSNVQPERRLRSAIAKGSASSASKPDADALAFSQPAQADAFDLSEPVDVLSKIPESFSELLDSPKWNERKQALEELKAIASVPRIKNDNFSDLVLQLAKCLQDANLFVVTVAAQCVAVLANGLRSDFTKYRSMLMQPAMDKLKEKKASVVEALGSALDGLFLASGISDILEDALKYSANKNPQIKTETLKFLTRSLRSTRVAPSNTDAKSIAEAGVQCLRDTIEHVRTAAAELLGTLMKIMGERFLAASLDGLDDLRKNKIKEFYEAAEVNAKAGALPPVQAKGRTVTGSRPTSRASVAPSSDSDAPRSRTSINPSRSSMAPSSLRVPRPSSASHSPGLKSSASASNTTSSSLEAPRLAQSSRTLVSRSLHQTTEKSRERKIDTGREDTQKIKSERDEFEAGVKRLLQEKADSESLRGKVEDRCRALESQTQSFEEQCRSLQTQLRKAEERIRSMESQNRNLEDKCQGLEARIHKVSSQPTTASTPMSLDSKSELEEKENLTRSYLEDGFRNSNGSNSVQNWKDAAEVTAALKQKIEQMRISARDGR